MLAGLAINEPGRYIFGTFKKAPNERMRSLFLTLDIALNFYLWIVIAAVVMSWLTAFGVINRSNQLADTVYRMLHSLTEPVFRPIRRALPDLGGLDISPIVVFLAIFFARSLMREYSLI
jgi:YggT family protein